MATRRRCRGRRDPARRALGMTHGIKAAMARALTGHRLNPADEILNRRRVEPPTPAALGAGGKYAASSFAIAMIDMPPS